MRAMVMTHHSEHGYSCSSTVESHGVVILSNFLAYISHTLAYINYVHNTQRDALLCALRCGVIAV